MKLKEKMCSIKHSIVFIYLLNFGSFAFGWDLKSVDDSGLNVVTNNNDYSIVHVSVFYVRAFISIRHRWNSTKSMLNAITASAKETQWIRRKLNWLIFIFLAFTPDSFTLIESTWPENILPIQSRVFPNDLSHAKSNCDCNGIIQSTQTIVDKNGLLWMIDNGSVYCAPKLIIFNLLKRNAEVHRHVFSEFKGGSFASIQLRHKFDANDIHGHEGSFGDWITCDAYISLHNEPFLILFSQRYKSWRRLHLISSILIKPNQIAIRGDNELLLTDTTNNLWTGNLNRIQLNNRIERQLTINIMPVGALLGRSQSMVSSSMQTEPFREYLYYYLPRDGAIVRWDFRWVDNFCFYSNLLTLSFDFILFWYSFILCLSKRK